MEHTDQRGQCKEIRVGLYKHALNLIQLTRSLPILRGLLESMRHTGKNLRLGESHWLELDGEREDKLLPRVDRVGGVDFHQLGAEVPEVIREHDWMVERGLARCVAIGGYTNIYTK